jgi:hypothetical protein
MGVATLMAVVTSIDTTNLAKEDFAHELALLRADMATMKHELIGAFRGELITAVTSLNKNLVFSVICAVVATAAAVVTAAQIG